MRAHALCAALAALLALATPATAHDYDRDGLRLHHPWTRATPAGAKVAGGYVEIANAGPSADRLIGGSFDASSGFEIHTMAVVDGVMTMRPLPDGVAVPAGQTVRLEPGGLHLMFTGLKRRLEPGTRVAGTLVFEKAGTVSVEFAVEALGASRPGDHAGQADQHQSH
jgi:copper(I)-binding protein